MSWTRSAVTAKSPLSRPRCLSRFAARLAAVGVGLLSGATLLALGAPAAFAAQPTVGLGTATSYAILAGSTITNTGPSKISGDIGVSPGSAITGFPPGTQTNGTMHAADAAAGKAKDDLTIAYNDARGRNPVTDVSAPLGGGQTLTAGIYHASSAMQLNGSLTLSGGPNDVFVFQAGSTLTTASNASVNLIGGASACNVFWQVGSSATLGSTTDFVGTIMADQSISLTDAASVRGRLLARTGAVTLINNVITRPDCATGGGSTPVPQGHPETGRPPAGADNSSTGLLLLLLGGGLALGGAAFASSRAIGRRPRGIVR